MIGRRGCGLSVWSPSSVKLAFRDAGSAICVVVLFLGGLAATTSLDGPVIIKEAIHNKFVKSKSLFEVLGFNHDEVKFLRMFNLSLEYFGVKKSEGDLFCRKYRALVPDTGICWDQSVGYIIDALTVLHVILKEKSCNKLLRKMEDNGAAVALMWVARNLDYLRIEAKNYFAVYLALCGSLEKKRKAGRGHQEGLDCTKSKHNMRPLTVFNTFEITNTMFREYEETWEDLRSNKLDVLYFFATGGGRKSFPQLWENLSLDGLERCLSFNGIDRYKQFGFVPPITGVKQLVSQVASASVMDTFTYSEGSDAKSLRYRVNGKYTTPAKSIAKSCMGLRRFGLWHNVGFMNQIREHFPAFGNLHYFTQ
ncbi:uncharacterized protein KNAG_0G02530 [Huiozyma naganishii CBS 8797]|uniref:Uncharacterized protein n=1 Tax=Huiozyma naganishii (strain ATCC MYA-139 / BCRC 22969 / CBS 8797 / KCTC 17520 / NBRC 10181 / NCYC 3082 / Yp74L-3) TaxID=1071383 RepID=J7S825_HUIN7|nr:hypothetical protein KNAG_0G02530 [Kazachstania naganishii CBS 8797]CCK71309.1 hypothetical protein KNAG_0G02530 [Kazachstania naganishii CBS 8797]